MSIKELVEQYRTSRKALWSYLSTFQFYRVPEIPENLECVRESYSEGLYYKDNLTLYKASHNQFTASNFLTEEQLEEFVTVLELLSPS